MLLDEFVKIAREKYSDKALDISSAYGLFSSDPTIQEELAQYKAEKKKK